MEIPVVATATGGPLDIIQSGINGFLVPARDAEALASNIQLLLLNREMTAAIAQSGRITVQRNFNVQETIHQLNNIYFSL
jgi:glycosyltransferase involved in cell wall biosynthesis